MEVKKWTLTIAGCVIALALLGTIKFAQIKEAINTAEAYPEQSESVEIFFVEETTYVPSISVLGEMMAPKRLDLRNEVAGEVTILNFESGSSIQEGQVLLQLDTSVEEANLVSAEARAELAQQVFDRAKNLYKSNVSSRDQLDRAQAELSSAIADISALKRTIEKKTLKAPFNGKAGLYNLEVGQYIPSNTFITTLLGDTNNIWVDFQVPQFYERLEAGTKIRISTIVSETDMTANNQLQSFPNKALNIPAIVIAENTIINPSNRSRSYRASLDNSQNLYLAHTMVKVELATSPERSVLKVPDVAIQNDAKGQYVYLLVPDDTDKAFRAIRQSIKLLVIKDGYALVETTTGLEKGQRIASAGAFKLYPGILVHAGNRQFTGAKGAVN
jgi:membrane fusion protein (multidrug efflux system)